MDNDANQLAKALLIDCPPAPTTRDWDALTEWERTIWCRYSATVLRVQVERQRETLRRDLAEARTPTPDPGRERSPEERAIMLAYALRRYARHLNNCPQTPCSCGLTELLGE